MQVATNMREGEAVGVQVAITMPHDGKLGGWAWGVWLLLLNASVATAAPLLASARPEIRK